MKRWKYSVSILIQLLHIRQAFKLYVLYSYTYINRKYKVYIRAIGPAYCFDKFIGPNIYIIPCLTAGAPVLTGEYYASPPRV